MTTLTDVTQSNNSQLAEIPETPVLIVDLELVKLRYRQLTEAMPWATPYYAVKANPESEVVSLLDSLGAHFDVASTEEIEICKKVGARPLDFSYGNTIKKPEAIRNAYRLGVPTFVFDSASELAKLAVHAPGSEVYCRLSSTASGAKWDLGSKFGCSPETAVELLEHSRDLGLKPRGVSFHVGSQQQDPRQWNQSIAAAANVFGHCSTKGLELDLLNIGGGFPVPYTEEVPGIGDFGKEIERSIRSEFGDRAKKLNVMSEPGRFLTAEAGTIHSTIVSSREASETGDVRWLYLDVGRFGGLAETEGEAIRYHFEASTIGDQSDLHATAIAGPTCDSADVMYKHQTYQLPGSLTPGDVLHIKGTGAYTASYSSVGFNGFPPLRTICVNNQEHR